MSPVSPEEWMIHSHWYRRDLSAEALGEMLSLDERLLRLLPGFLRNLSAEPPRRGTVELRRHLLRCVAAGQRLTAAGGNQRRRCDDPLRCV